VLARPSSSAAAIGEAANRSGQKEFGKRKWRAAVQSSGRMRRAARRRLAREMEDKEQERALFKTRLL